MMLRHLQPWDVGSLASVHGAHSCDCSEPDNGPCVRAHGLYLQILQAGLLRIRCACLLSLSIEETVISFSGTGDGAKPEGHP